MLRENFDEVLVVAKALLEEKTLTQPQVETLLATHKCLSLNKIAKSYPADFKSLQPELVLYGEL